MNPATSRDQSTLGQLQGDEECHANSEVGGQNDWYFLRYLCFKFSPMDRPHMDWLGGALKPWLCCFLFLGFGISVSTDDKRLKIKGLLGTAVHGTAVNNGNNYSYYLFEGINLNVDGKMSAT